MSLAGFIRRRGVTITVHRATETKRADGSTAKAWAVVQVNERALLEDITVELAQKLWGQQADATLRCTVMPTTDLRLRDGVTVNAGPHAGQRFLVSQAPDFLTGSGSDHGEFGLTPTQELF